MIEGIVCLGINKVAIIDDELSLQFNREELVNAGVDDTALDTIEDDTANSTSELLALLKLKDIPHSSSDERLGSLGIKDIREDIPQYFKEEIIDVFEEYKQENQEKLELIKESLIELGIDENNISEYTHTDGVNSDYDLIILDLFLKEGDPDISISFLKERIINDSANQYILMSHDEQALKSRFSEFHIMNSAVTTQIKLVPKAEDINDSQKSLWTRAIHQIATERCLIQTQKDVLNEWSELINNASKGFLTKIWELDLFGLNKLRLTASADNMTLTEYLAEVMHRGLLAEVQSMRQSDSKIDSLSCALDSVDATHLFNPSHEILDSYEKLNKLLADAQSLRFDGLESLPSGATDDNHFKKFISSLKFGSVLREKESRKLLLHITQPCDYQHIAENDADNHCLFLFPGTSSNLFENIEDGQKKITTSFIHIEEEIKNIRWNLRLVKTPTIGELYRDISKYEIVGELREDLAQAVSHKFGSTVSRVAYLRVPWFGKVEALHCKYNPESNSFDLTGSSQTQLTITSKKLSTRKDVERLFFHAYKETSITPTGQVFSLTLEAKSVSCMHSLVDDNLGLDKKMCLLDTLQIARNELNQHSDCVFIFLDRLKEIEINEEFVNIIKDKNIFVLIPPN